jgi:plastocyanin
MKTLALALAALSLAVAGCGSSDNSSSDSGSSAGSSSGSSSSAAPAPTTSSSSGGGGEQLSLSADPGGALKFDKSSLDAKAGKVTITMDNPSSLPHAVAVEGNGVDEDGDTVMQGGKSTVTVDLKPGKYEFYCPVDGHKAAGMEGTLTVK